MHRLQLIINNNMRLQGAENVAPGQFVIADEWTVIEPIGNQFECILLARVAKAISVDYERKSIITTHDLSSELFKQIIKASNSKYDPKVGYYWGVDAIVLLNKEYYSWFFCSNSTRFILERLPTHRQYLVTSELIDDRYWIPRLELLNV